MLDALKTIETSIFNGNRDSLPSPLIIGTFEKRAPGHSIDWASVKILGQENHLLWRKIRVACLRSL